MPKLTVDEHELTVIEYETTAGAYDIPMDRIVLDHPRHGRLLLIEGFGGHALEGQTYRWKHGDVFRLRPDDTLESLQTGGLPATDYDRMVHHYDDTRPSLRWEGYMIERMAARALTAPASLAKRG